MIFLTVGTQFPFDRLIRAVDEAVVRNGPKEKVFAQVGRGSRYRPRNFKHVPLLEKQVFDKCVKEASAIISHSGVGTIITALQHDKPLLVMPRLKKYGEVVNDHQLEIAEKFEQLGHVLVACDENDLSVKLQQLTSFIPKPRESQATIVARRIKRFLAQAGAARR